MVKIPDDFTPHTQGKCPVHPDTIVIAMMNDRALSPLPARDIDWDFPKDPVHGYKIVKPAPTQVN